MIAAVHINTARREDVTILKDMFCSTPFKVMNITEDKKAGEMELMLMSSSPGILDGDQYHITIGMDAGSSLQLHTQSYQRLFNMKQGANQTFSVHMAEGCSFVYLPHPSVPHAASSFCAINRIHLSASCRLIFGEILTCGRKLNGESFQFSRYQNLTEVFLSERLILKENLLLQPATSSSMGMGQFEGFTHQATFIYLQRNTRLAQLKADIRELLEQEEAIIFGITEPAAPGLLVKILGQGAEQLHDCLKRMSAVLTNLPTVKPLLDVK